VLVRIDDDGVGFVDVVEGALGFGVEIRCDAEVTAVGCIDVKAEAVFLAQGQDLVQRIDCANCSGAEGDDDGADIASGEGGLESGQVHAATMIGGDGGEGELEDGAIAAVGVVRLLGGDNFLPGAICPATQSASRFGEGCPRW